MLLKTSSSKVHLDKLEQLFLIRNQKDLLYFKKDHDDKLRQYVIVVLHRALSQI